METCPVLRARVQCCPTQYTLASLVESRRVPRTMCHSQVPHSWTITLGWAVPAGAAVRAGLAGLTDAGTPRVHASTEPCSLEVHVSTCTNMVPNTCRYLFTLAHADLVCALRTEPSTRVQAQTPTNLHVLAALWSPQVSPAAAQPPPRCRVALGGGQGDAGSWGPLSLLRRRLPVIRLLQAL